MGDGQHSKAGGGEDSTPTPNGGAAVNGTTHDNGHGHGHGHGANANGTGHLAASWRSSRAHLTVDDGLSTESEAESSYHGWSDAGWGASPANTHPRTSLSSSDEQPSPSASANPDSMGPSTGHPNTPTRTVSFGHRQNGSISHRRSTHSGARPGIHTVGSNASLDLLTPTATTPYAGTAVLPIDAVLAPPISSSTLMGGYAASPPSYSDAAGGSYAYPRSRRKSTSTHVVPTAGMTESETSTDDAYPLSGVSASAINKVKRKRSRGGSFSLPFHRRRRTSNAIWPRWLVGPGAGSGKHRAYPPLPRKRWTALVLLLVALAYTIYTLVRTYEIQLEFSVFSHRWVQSQIDDIQPLRGCFDPHNISPTYNASRNQPQHHLLSPGIAMRRGLSCYDFSSTIQPIPGEPLQQVTYHTYWRSDLIPFGERQTATLMAFLATQPLKHSKLILWTNGYDAVANNAHVRPFIEKWGEYVEVRQVDMNVLTKGTELEGLLSGYGGGLFDERAWVDGDAVRLLVLWHFGGVWMDMDQILTRDLHPLTESEFVTQWDCYDKPYFVLNGALMHFHQHSPYLCEAFHIMASSPLPKPNTFDWGSHLYSKLHRRLLAAHVKPFAVLPWCFADPRNCRSDIRFPDPFLSDPEYWGGRRWDGRGEVGKSGREMLEEKVGHVWTVHLHNQWGKAFPKAGWIERLLDGYRNQVKAIEAYAKAAGDVVGQRILVTKDLPWIAIAGAEDAESDSPTAKTGKKAGSAGGVKSEIGGNASGDGNPVGKSGRQHGGALRRGEAAAANPDVDVEDEEVRRLVEEVMAEDDQDENAGLGQDEGDE